MKCILCAKEIHGEKVKWVTPNSALCPDCAALNSKKSQPDDDYEYDDYPDDTKNTTGTLIQLVAFLIWLFGGIAAFIAYAAAGVPLITLIIYVFSVFVSGLLIYGLGEIILLLGQINAKLTNKRR